jgi:hypothetical protein
MDGKRKKNGKKRKRKKKPPLRADETKIVKAENVPAGSEFKGYTDFFVQKLVIKSVTTRYQREQWLRPDGKTLTAALDFESAAPHFGPTMCSFVLYQYYHAQVTEPLKPHPAATQPHQVPRPINLKISIGSDSCFATCSF